uniref:Uncharacterized protein n=1 Tax=Ditylenchus dipsaci TaxID=166011 RepID=A0A915CRW7_9BILA
MFFGISMWCMGWNLVAVFVAPQSCWQFLPALFLGLMISISGCHTHRISSSRRYKNLFSFIPFCFVYIMSGLSIMQKSVASALESITYSDDLAEFTYNGKPETFMSIGNFMLMCFVCYCNVFALKLILERLGSWFDEFDKSDKKLAEVLE